MSEQSSRNTEGIVPRQQGCVSRQGGQVVARLSSESLLDLLRAARRRLEIEQLTAKDAV